MPYATLGAIHVPLSFSFDSALDTQWPTIGMFTDFGHNSGINYTGSPTDLQRPKTRLALRFPDIAAPWTDAQPNEFQH